MTLFHSPPPPSKLGCVEGKCHAVTFPGEFLHTLNLRNNFILIGAAGAPSTVTLLVCIVVHVGGLEELLQILVIVIDALSIKLFEYWGSEWPHL